MSRLRLLAPHSMSEAQQALYDAIASGKRAAGRQLFKLTHDDGTLTGPFNTLLYAPKLGAPLAQLGEEIRFGAALSDRTRELAILVIARRWMSDYEWYAHSRIGRDIGLSEEILEAIRNGEVPHLDHPQEAAAYNLCVAVAYERHVSDTVYAEVSKVLTERAIVELTILIGYYTTLAMLLEVFAIGVPEGRLPLSTDPASND
jgi:alkylhydroperoxidase family enzyme